jgi:hypothetical protein
MSRDNSHTLSSKVDAVMEGISAYLRDNARLIAVLAIVALAAYGFELFNFNLTIDEELSSLPSSNALGAVSPGRWAGVLLSKYLFPLPVIPFLPLFVGLIFHIAAILLILSSLEMKGKLQQAIFGSVCLAFPGLAYIYTFSTASPGVGIGLFCDALALYLIVRNRGLRKFWAVIPAVFALSFGQAVIPVLLSVFLLYVIYVWDHADGRPLKTLLGTAGIYTTAIVVYLVADKLFLFLLRAPVSNYVAHFFSIDYLRSNPGWIVYKLALLMFHVYTGGDSVYGIHVHALGALLFVSALGFLWTIVRCRVNLTGKALLLLITLGFVLIPFVGGLFMRGNLPMRDNVAVAVVIPGLVILGLKNAGRLRQMAIAALALLCLFQFASSTNHLFGSSHLALQQDRLTGLQMIERIEDAQASAGSGAVKYIEVIGLLHRPSTRLIPKLETFGASFFEWDQGNAKRVVAFLQILGYYGVEPLPLEQRRQFVGTADSMPTWPDRGSVKVVGDVALIKFGPYSKNQEAAMEPIGR